MVLLRNEPVSEDSIQPFEGELGRTVGAAESGRRLSLMALTLIGHMPLSLLLVFTSCSVRAAVELPAWQAGTPELVPRHQIRSAARLEMVGVNLSRAAGPALGVIARFGVPTVFALNALSVIPLGIALLLWRRTPPEVPVRTGAVLASPSNWRPVGLARHRRPADATRRRRIIRTKLALRRVMVYRTRQPPRR
jgi:hypothetical protein